RGRCRIKGPPRKATAASRRARATPAAMGGGGKGKGKSKGSSGDDEFDKIAKRATWLNHNVFTESQINNDAVNAVAGMGIARAMALFKEIEEKVDEIRNPSNYLCAAAKKEGFHAPDQGKGGGGKSASGGKSAWKGKTIHAGASGDVNPKVQKRAEWLNDKVFTDRPINRKAMEIMSTLDIPSAMSLFRELEEMGDSCRNPSGFLVSRSRDGSSSPAIIAAAPRDKGDKGKGKGKGDKGKGKGGGGGKSGASDEDRIEKRAQWLNKNTFVDRPLDDDSVCALMGMDLGTAMDIFQELEEKSVGNPSAYVKKAAKAMGLAPAEDAAPPPRSKGGGKSKNPKPPPPPRGTISTIGKDPKKRPAPGDGPPAKKRAVGSG
ncbi:unnamed protein product, partial [Prorocentrum cordatum]